MSGSRGFGGRVVFDEVHRLDDPSLLLKIAADSYTTLRVLATGSSTLTVTRKFRKEVYRLLRYSVQVKAAAGENTETISLIDWEKPELNDFAIAILCEPVGPPKGQLERTGYSADDVARIKRELEHHLNLREIIRKASGETIADNARSKIIKEHLNDPAYCHRRSQRPTDRIRRIPEAHR